MQDETARASRQEAGFRNTLFLARRSATLMEISDRRFVSAEAKLRYKTLVSQLVLLFSKLQAGIIKGLSDTGLFPCNPPLTPMIYANGNGMSPIMLISALVGRSMREARAHLERYTPN